MKAIKLLIFPPDMKTGDDLGATLNKSGYKLGIDYLMFWEQDEVEDWVVPNLFQVAVIFVTEPSLPEEVETLIRWMKAKNSRLTVVYFSSADDVPAPHRGPQDLCARVNKDEKGTFYYLLFSLQELFKTSE